MAAILSTIEKQTPLENRTDLYRSTCSVYQPQLYFKNNFLLQDSTIPSLIEQSSFHRYLDYWWAFCIPLCFLLLIQILPFPYWLTGFITGLAVVRTYFLFQILLCDVQNGLQKRPWPLKALVSQTQAIQSFGLSSPSHSTYN